MAISENKSSFLEYGLDDGTLVQLKSLFPFEVKSLDVGFKYLGIFLKPNSYLKEDWFWLDKNVEKRIGHWCNRWLTLGGRYILVKSILENIPVY